MIKLLARIFIKNPHAFETQSVRNSYGALCGALGIVLNLLLFGIKYLVGTIAGSVAVTADAFNNIADASSSMITMLGFQLARQKPDSKHPFGHGRIEYISGLLVSIVISLVGFELLRSSYQKIVNPATIRFSWLTVVVLCLSIAVKLYMALYNKSIGKRICSTALRAVYLDSLSDVAATSVVLVSMPVAYFLKISVDGWCGALISLFILFTGIKSGIDTVQPLLGQVPDSDFVKRIEDIILSFDGITAMHDLVVHDYGPTRRMITLHAEMDGDSGKSVFAMHDVIDNAERRLQTELGCNATIHLDPVAYNDEQSQSLMLITIGILNEIDPRLSMHDFRIVPGPTHVNLIFDVVAPYKFHMSDNDLADCVRRSVALLGDNEYFAIVTIDKEYSETVKS